MSAVYYKLVYNVNRRLDKNGTAPVNVEIYQNRKRKYYNTGIKLTPKQWDERRKRVRNHPNATEINWYLQTVIEKLQKYEYRKRKEYGYFDIKMFNNFDINSGDNDFWAIFNHYLINHNVSKSRKDYIRRTIRKLQEYDENITFQNFNLNTIMGFDTFLRKQDYHPNTIAHFHKVVRAFLNYAIKLELLDKNPYMHFKIKTEKTERVFLTEEEVAAIEKLELENGLEGYDLVKDLFLFSCYTGLRFADIQALKPKNFDFTEEGIYMTVKQQKTKTFVKMPLHMLFDGKPIKILKKYFDPNKERVFPKITNQDANRKLKYIQHFAKINKTLTFHVARHTFGTLLAIVAKDPYLIKELMGHADIQTSMTYIHMSNQLIKQKLSTIEWDKYLKG